MSQPLPRFLNNLGVAILYHIQCYIQITEGIDYVLYRARTSL
jgi:hypothetical protein